MAQGGYVEHWCLVPHGDSIFSGVQFEIVLHPSLHLFIAVGDDLPVFVFSEIVFFMDGPVAFFIPSYMPLNVPCFGVQLDALAEL